MPILAHEQGLQTITAEPWLEISDKGLQLEGLCFDRNGDLVLCEVFGELFFMYPYLTKNHTIIKVT